MNCAVLMIGEATITDYTCGYCYQNHPKKHIQHTHTSHNNWTISRHVSSTTHCIVNMYMFLADNVQMVSTTCARNIDAGLELVDAHSWDAWQWQEKRNPAAADGCLSALMYIHNVAGPVLKPNDSKCQLSQVDTEKSLLFELGLRYILLYLIYIYRYVKCAHWNPKQVKDVQERLVLCEYIDEETILTYNFI